MSTSSSANQAGMGSVGAGAATGAAVGSLIAPGVGTLIGASIGAAVGGIGGAIGLGKKAKKNAKRARWLQQEREKNAQEATYLQMIRRARMARTGSLAASTAYGLASSSLATSALSSIGSQSQYSVQYTANDQRLVELINKYMKKAGDYAKSAQTTLAIGELSSLAFGVGAVGASASAAAETAGAEAVKQASQSSAMGLSGTTLTAIQNAAYQEAFTSGMQSLALWSNFASPIYQGVSQYNQI